MYRTGASTLATSAQVVWGRQMQETTAFTKSAMAGLEITTDTAGRRARHHGTTAAPATAPVEPRRRRAHGGRAWTRAVVERRRRRAFGRARSTVHVCWIAVFQYKYNVTNFHHFNFLEDMEFFRKFSFAKFNQLSIDFLSKNTWIL